LAVQESVTAGMRSKRRAWPRVGQAKAGTGMRRLGQPPALAVGGRCGGMPRARRTVGLHLRRAGELDETLVLCREACRRDPAFRGAVVKNLRSGAKRRLRLRAQDLRRAPPDETAGPGR
jgi:hypothetical protein